MTARTTVRALGAAALALGLVSLSLVAATAASADDVVPVSFPDTYSMMQGTSLSVPAPGVLGNDQCNGVKTVVDPGDLSIGVDGAFVYTSEPTAFGTKYVEYRMACDGVPLGFTSTVYIEVTAAPVPDPVANAAPTAVTDNYAAAPGDNVYDSGANGVLANDTDPEGDTLTLVGASGAESYLKTINADGTFILTAPLGFVGTISFSYEATDGNSSSVAQANVTFSAIGPVNAAPNAMTDSYAADFGANVFVSGPFGLLANDTDPEGDPITVTEVLADSWTPVVAPDGTFTLTVDAGYVGEVTFNYVITDGTNINIGHASVLFGPPSGPHSIVGTPDFYSTPQDTTLVVDAPGVLANDAITGAQLHAIHAHDGGTISPSPDGSFSWTPAAGFVGDATFDYTVYNGEVESDWMVVTITVTPASAATPTPTLPEPGAPVVADEPVVDTASVLAHTGVTNSWLVAPATALLVSGGAALLFAGRRRRAL